MTIEIHQPELEAIIQQRLATGDFADIEDLLRQALLAVPLVPANGSAKSGGAASTKTLLEVFAEIRGLADDLDFPRDPSPMRPTGF